MFGLTPGSIIAALIVLVLALIGVFTLGFLVYLRLRGFRMPPVQQTMTMHLIDDGKLFCPERDRHVVEGLERMRVEHGTPSPESLEVE